MQYFCKEGEGIRSRYALDFTRTCCNCEINWVSDKGSINMKVYCNPLGSKPELLDKPYGSYETGRYFVCDRHLKENEGYN